MPVCLVWTYWTIDRPQRDLGKEHSITMEGSTMANSPIPAPAECKSRDKCAMECP
jgi:hypothetical protein